MIQLLRQLFGKKAPEEEKQVVALDLNNIYVRLRMALDRVGSTQLQLNASPASLGRIESFSETMSDFLKSLMEVNQVLKEHRHVESGLFYIKRVGSVKFDKFLFVEKGYYVTDAPVTLQKVLDQIETYYELIKDADKALYGVMEHNHRQLYSYTETVIGFLNAIFDHFGE